MIFVIYSDMKKILLLLALVTVACGASAQAVYTRICGDLDSIAAADAWVASRAWAGDFKANPHYSVNAIDFSEQYAKNQAQWDAMFKWLAETDLLNIEKGKHPIGDSGLVASVEDSSNGPLAKRKSESHYKHIDFQYVVKGTERFGVIDHLTSEPNTPYKPDVIHYAYDPEKAMFYDSDPNSFFLFFPADWHIAKVETELPDQTIRVIVVKLDYIE